MDTWLGYNVDFLNPNIHEYNNIKVYYCKDCLSLSISELIEGMPSCTKCNNGDVGLCSIEEWDLMFYDKYKYHYLDKKSRLIDGIRTKIK